MTSELWALLCCQQQQSGPDWICFWVVVSMSVPAHNVFIFMLRLLIIPRPRLNEATCLVVAHDCSVYAGCQAQTIEYRSQSLPSLFTPVQISASTNKHFIGCIICGAIFNEINFLDEGIVSSDITLFVSFISVARIKMLRRVRVTLQVTCHSIQLWCAEDYNIIICIRPVYQPGSLHNAHVSHLIYKL